jgi:hypothetical protein
MRKAAKKRCAGTARGRTNEQQRARTQTTDARGRSFPPPGALGLLEGSAGKDEEPVLGTKRRAFLRRPSIFGVRRAAVEREEAAPGPAVDPRMIEAVPSPSTPIHQFPRNRPLPSPRSSECISRPLLTAPPTMDLILDVALTSPDEAPLTPLEALRDFAYASPGWHYLEDASRHYAEEKGRDACILRHHVLGGSTDVDLAFARRPASPRGDAALHLTVIEPEGAERPFDAEERDEIARHFVEHLRAHLDRQGRHAEVHVERGEMVGGNS